MLFRIYKEHWWQLHIALRHCMQWIIFHKVNVPRPLLGRGPVRFDSCKRPPPVSDHSVCTFSVVAYGRLVFLASVLWMSRSSAWQQFVTSASGFRFEKQSCIQPSWSITFKGCMLFISFLLCYNCLCFPLLIAHSMSVFFNWFYSIIYNCIVTTQTSLCVVET